MDPLEVLIFQIHLSNVNVRVGSGHSNAGQTRWLSTAGAHWGLPGRLKIRE